MATGVSSETNTLHSQTHPRTAAGRQFSCSGEPGMLLFTLHPLTALMPGGFSLDSIQTNFQEEKHMESTHGYFSLLGAGQIVTCRLDELRPHPAYVRHHLAVPASQLSALAERGDRAFVEPLVITQDGTILDGYARLELARLQGRATLLCIVYELTKSEALRWLLEKHRRCDGLNAFCRILLALELEPWFKEKARSNQQAGGRHKGSSKLTEAARLDVRSKIAVAAGVSVGNVTKVKQLTTTVHSDLLQALRSGEISIHRGWRWSKAPPEKQREEFQLYQGQRGVKKTIRLLLSQHRSKSLPAVLDLNNLARQLSALESKLGVVTVGVIKAPGRTVFLTEELVQALGR